MSNLTNRKLRKLIMQELSALVGEDVLMNKSMQKSGTPPMGSSSRFDKAGCCTQCGEDKSVCECGTMYEEDSLKEGSCGCSPQPSHPHAVEPDINQIDYHRTLRQLMGLGDISMDSNISGGHHSGAYMSKSQLYKVHEYSGKLYSMIPEGHDLEDWMRTKIAQIADDMSEVYHALAHDVYKGEL